MSPNDTPAEKPGHLHTHQHLDGIIHAHEHGHADHDHDHDHDGAEHAEIVGHATDGTKLDLKPGPAR